MVLGLGEVGEQMEATLVEEAGEPQEQQKEVEEVALKVCCWYGFLALYVLPEQQLMEGHLMEGAEGVLVDQREAEEEPLMLLLGEEGVVQMVS